MSGMWKRLPASGQRQGCLFHLSVSKVWNFERLFIDLHPDLE
jgi:hypothetical protein